MPPKRKQTIKLNIGGNKKHRASSAKAKQQQQDNVPLVEPTHEQLHQFLNSLYAEILHFKDPSSDLIITEPFLKVPPKKLYPDYYQIIKSPISLHEIKLKIKSSPKSKPKNFYTSLAEFVDDFKLLSDNANTYNDSESLIAKDAVMIYRFVESQVDEYRKQLSLEEPKYDIPDPETETPSATTLDNDDNSYNGETAEEERTKSKRSRRRSHTKKEEEVHPIKEEKPKPEKKSRSHRAPTPTPLPEIHSDIGYVPQISTILRNVCNFRLPQKGRLAEPFLELVDQEDEPDYYNVIKEPISLNMIRLRMNNGEYDNDSHGVWKFKKDMYQVFSNGQLYYDEESNTHRLAVTLHGFFKKKIDKFKEQVPAYKDDEPDEELEDDESGKKSKILRPDGNEEEESNESSGTGAINGGGESEPVPIQAVDEIPNFVRKHDLEQVPEVLEIDDITAFVKKFTFSSAIKQYSTYLPDNSQFFEYSFIEPAGNSIVGGSTYSINLSSNQVIGQSLLILVNLQNRIIDEKYLTELKINNEILKPQPLAISYDEDDSNADFLACKYEFKLTYGLNLLEFHLKVPFPLVTKSLIKKIGSLEDNDNLVLGDSRLTRSSRLAGGSKKKQEDKTNVSGSINGDGHEWLIEKVKVWVSVSQ